MNKSILVLLFAVLALTQAANFRGFSSVSSYQEGEEGEEGMEGGENSDIEFFNIANIKNDIKGAGAIIHGARVVDSLVSQAGVHNKIMSQIKADLSKASKFDREAEEIESLFSGNNNTASTQSGETFEAGETVSENSSDNSSDNTTETASSDVEFFNLGNIGNDIKGAGAVIHGARIIDSMVSHAGVHNKQMSQIKKDLSMASKYDRDAQEIDSMFQHSNNVEFIGDYEGEEGMEGEEGEEGMEGGENSDIEFFNLGNIGNDIKGAGAVIHGARIIDSMVSHAGVHNKQMSQIKNDLSMASKYDRDAEEIDSMFQNSKN